MDISGILTRKKDKTLFLPITDIAPNPLQPRKAFDESELRSLAESLRCYGILQPIVVKRAPPLPFPRAAPQAPYEIIAGERRWRAAALAGIKKIPCTLLDADRTESAMMALTENLQRSDLSFFEEAVAMQNLLLMTSMTQSELARMLSVSQPTLSNKLRLLKLSERERTLITENHLSERHARALLRLETERERMDLLIRVIDEGLSATETERIAEERQKKKCTLPAAPQKPAAAKPIRKVVIRDMRFFFNTIDKAVRLLSDSGFSADWRKTEKGDEYEVTIKVRK